MYYGNIGNKCQSKSERRVNIWDHGIRIFGKEVGFDPCYKTVILRMVYGSKAYKHWFLILINYYIPFN